VIGILKQFFNRQKITFLAIIFSSIGAMAAVKFLMFSTTASPWQKATDIATVAQLDKVLETNIDRSKLDRRYILNTLSALQVGNFTVYRFTYPETTGTDGSLYVISDNYSKQRPIQLWRNPIFSPVAQDPSCLNVIQNEQAYTICP
jgi:hypothetical protein